jgi:hypothetical protein
MLLRKAKEFRWSHLSSDPMLKQLLLMSAAAKGLRLTDLSRLGQGKVTKMRRRLRTSHGIEELDRERKGL